MDIDILQHAHQILYERTEEKERQYGPFSEGIERAAMIASGISGKDVTPRDIYIALISLKFSRESYNPKYDNILDALVYMAQMYEHDKDKY